MEIFSTVFFIASLIVSILNLILFFKIWGMCNNVEKIKNFLIERMIRQNYSSEKQIEGLTTGDLVYDSYNRLCRIKDITEEGNIVCTILDNGITITISPRKVEKKELQFVE